MGTGIIGGEFKIRCPGEATNPVFIPLKNIKPGKHVMKIAIAIGEREGGSFSHWNISGVLIGEK